MSYHVQSNQGKIFRKITVFEILALHARECSDLDEVYTKIGKKYQWLEDNSDNDVSGEFGKEYISNSMCSKCEGF